jgi:uncharacterized protein
VTENTNVAASASERMVRPLAGARGYPFSETAAAIDGAPMIRLRFPWTGCLAGRALALGFLLPLAPVCSRAQTESPQLLSATGGQGRQPWKNLAELRKAAAAGDPAACLQLGWCFENGNDVPRDYAQALALYEQAAAGGVADAIYRLGKLHQDGLGVEPDAYQARDLYEVAALANVPLAQYNLGAMLVSARGGHRDFVEGLAWLILASRNHLEADGERRVRDQLAAQPQVIAAAEQRAEQLGREVAVRKGAKPPWPLPAATPDSSAPPAVAAPLAKAVLPPPKIDPPKVDPPPPPVFSPPAIPAPAKP